MEKIKAIIDKILGKSSGSDSSDSSSGFTLIELLIVIAVIGILAAALLVAIDPIDKVNAGRDTKVLNDIRSIHDAAIRHYTNTGILPTSGNWNATDATATLVGGELKSIPNQPGGYTAYVYNQNGTDVYVCGQVKSKASYEKGGDRTVSAGYVYVSGGRLCYRAAAGETCPVAYTAPLAGGSLCQ